MTNKQIISAFIAGKKSGKANSMFIETSGNSTVLYSYGYHFPMAIRTEAGQYSVNMDKYSMTTSKQQGMLRRALAVFVPSNTQELRGRI